MESERKRKPKRQRRKGYRRLLKKPLKGFQYRQKKYPVRENPKKPNEPVICPNESCTPEIDHLSGTLEDGGISDFSQSVSLQEVKVSLYHTPGSLCKGQKPAIRCLSLFDGIGTGFYCLRKIGLEVEEYFSSEIDEKAIEVLKLNYFGNITFLGCVKTVTPSVLQCLGRIDLLLGGSPCSDLSLCNPARKGFSENSTANLFFDFSRILEWLQKEAHSHNRPFYYLYENTTKMETKNKTTMCKTLLSTPVQRCSSRHVKMTRNRNFWGNIPGLHDPLPQLEKNVIPLQDCLMPYHTPVVESIPTLTTSVGSQRQGPKKKLPVTDSNGNSKPLSAVEEERMFGLPDHYTDTGHLSITDRRKLLGKAWSVSVVTEILLPLKAIFRTT